MQVDLSPAVPIHANDPGAIKQMIDALTQGLLDDIGRPLLAEGIAIWQGLAVILVVWTGLRMAFSGGFQAWEAVRLVTSLAIPRTILHFYDRPLPLGGRTLPELIVGQGAWLADMIAQDAFSSFMTWLNAFGAKVNAEVLGSFTWWNPLAWIDAGVDLASGALVLVLSLVMYLLALLLLVVGYAQVIWAQFALSIAVAVGPVLIPFLLIGPLAFLFWGWFRTLITYSLYAAVAAAVFRVFVGAIRVAGEGLWAHITNDLASLGAALMWVVSYAVIAGVGLVASFKIPELAGSLVSGQAAGGDLMAPLYAGTKIVSAAKTGGMDALRGK